MAFQLKLTKLFQFIRLLTIEPYVFLLIFANLVMRIPFEQLIQDKICIQDYGQSNQYCKNLPQMTAEEDSAGVKSSVLADSTHFNMYITFMTIGPSMIVCLFLGPFMDKYPPSKKFLFLISAALLTVETSFYIANCYFFDWDYRLILIGKLLPTILFYPMVTMAAVWCYITTVTPAHVRAIRMITMELAFFLATPISTLLSGIWLNNDPYFVGRELRNYSTVFAVTIGCSILSFLFAWFFINEEKETSLFIKYFPEPVSDQIVNDPNNNTATAANNDLENVKQTPKVKISKPKYRFAWKMLLNTKNVKKMFQTLIKPRPYRIRMQLTMSMISVILYIFTYFSPLTILFQYVQHVFNWESEQYSQYMSMSQSINLITSFLFSPILLKVVKISDISLTMISIGILFIQLLIRSMTTSLAAFYIALIFCSMNLIGTIGLRNYISRIIDPSEIGAIFTIISLGEQIAMLINSGVITNIFTMTIDSQPNTAFYLLAFLTWVDMLLVFTVSYFSDRTLKALKENPIEIEEEEEEEADKEEVN